MGVRFAAACAALAALALISPVSAQPVSPPPGDEVVVTAIRPAQMRNFVRELAEPGKNDQLSRWDGRVCPGVVGVGAQAAQALIDRIVMRAFAVGLDGGRPGCRANVLVIVTPDATAFTPDFVDQNKRFFSYYEDSGNALGREALDQFARSSRPIRWWHVTQTVTDSGIVLGNSVATSNTDGSFDNAQVARVRSASRVRAGTREDFKRVIVIVDATAVAGKPFTAVADYVAMVSLAQIRADASRTGLDTILALFDPPAEGQSAAQEWTAWDRAYVEGLYAANPFARSARQQENAIVRRVEDAAKEAPEPAPAPPPPR
jgi:hypothetical protein